MDADDLIEYVGAPSGSTYAASCWDQAVAMVDRYVGTVVVDSSILDRAYLEVAAELYNRKGTKNGIRFDGSDGFESVRIVRDPMIAAYSILAPSVGRGIS